MFAKIIAELIVILILSKNKSIMSEEFTTYLLWILLLVLAVSIVVQGIKIVKKWKGEENQKKNRDHIKTVIKNRYDDYLKENPITEKINVDSNRQNRLDEVLAELAKRECQNISWNELQTIAKEALAGLNIGHSSNIL